MFTLGSTLPLAPSLHYNPVNKGLSLPTLAIPMKRKSRQQHCYYAMDPPGLLDEIAAAAAPLTGLPQRVNLHEYIDHDKDAAELTLQSRRIRSAMEKIKTLNVNEKALGILARWNCELNRVTVQGLARGYLAGKTKITDQLRKRQSILNSLKLIDQPSIPSRLLQSVRKDCTAAIKSLNFELKCYKNVLNILKRNGAKLTRQSEKTIHKSKPRDPSTARAIKELDLLLTPAYPIKNARAKIIYQLLKMVDPRHAPQSPGSIRTGYLSRAVFSPLR